MIDFSDGQISRFFDKVEKSDNCWIWKGKKNRGGYGEVYFQNDGKKYQYRAHRVCYKLYVEDPGFFHVLHKCDNRLCVKPEHLFLGTNRDNVDDRHKKGRTSCRISWDTVRKMREDFLKGMKTRDIDKKYNYVSSHAILQNRLWYDPAYNPPQKTSGPIAKLIEIYGEIKKVEEWATDIRCQVSARTIRKRYREGIRGFSLLIKTDNRGRRQK